MTFTPEKTAVAAVLAVAGLTVIFSGAARLSNRLAAAESTASEAFDVAKNVDGRLSDAESTISDLSDTSEDHDNRLDNVESQQLMRSW